MQTTKSKIKKKENKTKTPNQPTTHTQNDKQTKQQTSPPPTNKQNNNHRKKKWTNHFQNQKINDHKGGVDLAVSALHSTWEKHPHFHAEF